MITIENPGSELDKIIVNIDGKYVKLNENSDPNVLYAVVEELSRMILKFKNNQKER
jgi:hypothetical protein